ncbi:steroid 17-alpha-hydroxylase/17,20 lyase-like [Dendronephthya gigantea]|uniref:steroid 17-alpha-hydroxylase/17,20 lyase-like n=1 Tax=Dendronephthya gigantea TaxID=151771 RepID=UPI001068E5E5|nr:steroid 17-alpha-hydroxylase/17,20 lyase-like [Dendronephthya gigantea]
MYPWSVIQRCKNVATADYSTAYLFRKRVFKTALHTAVNGVEKVEDRARSGLVKAIKEIDRKNGEPFSALELFESAIIAQLWEWLTSKSVSLDDAIVKSSHELGYILSNLAKQASLYQMFPFLAYFPTKFNRDIKRAKQLVDDLFLPEFHAHQQTYVSGIIRDLTDSFITLYERERTKDGITEIGSTEDIPYLMLDVIIAGTDTTSTALSWFILYMVLYDDIQIKIQKEIDVITTNDSAPAWKDVQNMSYLQATLCEVLRISGLVQHTGTNAIRDTTIAGYHVPKGTLVVLNLKQALHDEREWSEPVTFKPERFLGSDGRFVGWSKLRGFVPFGLGRRECLGQSVAKMTLLTYASALLHRYKFELPDKEALPSTDVSTDALLLRPNDFKVVAKYRSRYIE